MDKSPGLALYRRARLRIAGFFAFLRRGSGAALADDTSGATLRGQPQKSSPPVTARPDGPLIWFNIPGPGSARAISELIRRVTMERADLTYLVTSSTDTPQLPGAAPPNVLYQSAPIDTPQAIRLFLDHWRPSIAVFAEGDLLPALIEQAYTKGIALFLIDGRAARGTQSWMRRSTGMTKTLLQRFDRILVQDAAAARYFRRLGAPAWRLEAAGKMEDGTGALPCTEAERDALAQHFRPRPILLAACVPEVEEASVLAALRLALRLSHRLLLILVPEDPARGPALADLATEMGWSVALRSRDDDLDDEDQVYIADTEGEYGLWYRLAPITFMGGTLLGSNGTRHPFEPAALGSAILHGPITGLWGESYVRLVDAGAARLVRNAVELGDAVSDLMSPDKAALMAQSAWQVSSSGAEVTDRVVRLLLDTLESRGDIAAKAAGPVGRKAKPQSQPTGNATAKASATPKPKAGA